MNGTTLGNYIATRRRALRLTQQEISERLRGYGVERSASAIANWETDKQSIPVEILPALANSLEISIVLLYAKAGQFQHAKTPSSVALLRREYNDG